MNGRVRIYLKGGSGYFLYIDCCYREIQIQGYYVV